MGIRVPIRGYLRYVSTLHEFSPRTNELSCMDSGKSCVSNCWIHLISIPTTQKNAKIHLIFCIFQLISQITVIYKVPEGIS